MRNFDVAIIGAGIMGAAAACELARDGDGVILVDQSSLPNPEAASFDHSKVFRFAYPDPFYVRLAVDARKRWKALEEETSARLMTQTGALLIGKRRPSFETDCYDAMRSLDLNAELLSNQEAGARFPQFNPDSFQYAVYDPSGAILYADAAVTAVIELARTLGVTILERERVISFEQTAARSVSIVTETGKTIAAERAMIAAGPWTRAALPFLAGKLSTTFQEIVYFEPARQTAHALPLTGRSFEPGSFPIFLELESGFYGFPVHYSGAMKIANHHKGAEIDPYSDRQPVGERFIERCREFFAEFIPELATARVRETRVCIYNNTPDDDFIIDWHPELEGVLVVTGFSGHGFKFAPTIGRIAGDLLRAGQTSYDIDRFRLGRLSNSAR